VSMLAMTREINQIGGVSDTCNQRHVSVNIMFGLSPAFPHASMVLKAGGLYPFCQDYRLLMKHR
jgi:hypothetical protein